MLPRPDYCEIDRKALKTPTYDLTQYVKKRVKIDGWEGDLYFASEQLLQSGRKPADYGV